MNLIDFIQKLYLYVRRFIKTPVLNEKLTKKIDEYFKSNEKINDLIELVNKEFTVIFLNEKTTEEITKFKKNLPFNFLLRKEEKNFFNLISLITKKTEEKNEEEKEINVEKIIEYITNHNYYLNIIVKTDNSFSIEKISLNLCTILDNSKEIEYDNTSFTLFECFEYFKDKELLKINEWFCKKCKKHQSAVKQKEFFYLPKLFIICLKRFSQDKRYKSSNFINFPLDNMDMKDYVVGPDKNHSIYDCFAVNQHYESLGVGHYKAICKNIDNKWYLYDDSSCSETNKNQVISDAAYVVFYRRKPY